MTTRSIASALKALAIPAAIALASIPGTATAAGNLVVNGSFELGLNDSPGIAWLTDIPGWTGMPDIEVRSKIEGVAQDGLYFVELDTSANSSMYQMLDTVAGQAYNLSFWFAPRTGVASNSNNIDVFWNGAMVDGVTSDGGAYGDPVSWTHYTYTVFGTGGQVALRFAAGGNSDTVGGSLDNVSVTAVPEPETYAMLLAGLGMMGAMVRRRRT